MAEATVVKTGKTICLSEARISDPGGRLPAHGTITMRALDSLPLKGQAALPPKFLD